MIDIFEQNTVVLCNTKKEAEELCAILHAFGYRWSSGESLLDTTYFHKEPIVYNSRSTGSTNYVQYGAYENGESYFLKEYKPQVLTLYEFKCAIGAAGGLIQKWM